MAIQGVNPACYILALFIRDDGERFLLGSGFYEFKEKQMHFSANSIENDTISVQGNDGYLLSGQVRRPGSQDFNGFVGDGTVDKATTEQKRRDFFRFFRKNFFYKVIYVFPNGTAIQRKRGFLVDDPTVKELYQIYPEYHVALNFEDVNYYSYAEDDDGHEIYAKVAEISLTASAASGGLMWDTYGVIWEDIDYAWSSAPGGTSFVILNQLDMRAKIKDLVIQGDTTQQTYSGKNLFSGDYAQFDNTGGTGNVYAYFKLPTNDVYTMSLIAKHDFTPSSSYYLGFSREGGQATLGYKWAFQGYTTAITKGTVYSASNYLNDSPMDFVFMYPKTSDALQWLVDNFDIQVELGNTRTDYEKYVGGTASPNPDYPQDIDVVTGEQTVTISDGANSEDYKVHLTSKNLLNMALLNDGYVQLDGTITSLHSTGEMYSNFIKVEPNTSYVFSIIEKTLSNPQWFGIGEYTTANTSSFVRRDTQNIETATSITFTTSATTKYVIVSARNLSGATKVQLEVGDQATSYQEYYNYELAKIGTYQDYIYKSGDDWYVHKAIENITLDGTQSIAIPNWRASATSVGWVYAYNEFNSATIAANSVGAIVSNKLLAASFTSLFDKSLDIGIALYTNTDYGLAVRVKDPTLTTSSAVNTYLGSNPIDVYYPLATPTDTKITDSDLIDDFNGLGALRLFAGNNMVTVTTTGSNLPAPVQFKYATAYTSTGAVWEAGGPSGPTTVSVDSIAQVFPVWEVKGPAVNPQLSVLTTGTTITYAGSVTSSQTLVIDMFNKTATLNGTSVIGNVTGDWISFKPGTNRVVYTTGNADAQPSLIKWQEIVG